MFCEKNDVWILTNNLNFGLLEIVEGTFLKIPIFRQFFDFSNFWADFPLLKSKSMYFELIIWVSDCTNLYFECLNLYCWCLNLYRLFWVSELIFWVSELILWVSELISLVLGVWTYTLGIRGPSILVCPVTLEILKDQAFWYHLWIWKYWRTKYSGTARESANTEGPTILVWYAPFPDKQGGGPGGR